MLSQLAANYFARSPVLAFPIAALALFMIVFVVGAGGIILAYGDKEDRPPGMFMTLLAILISSGIAATAMALGRGARASLLRAKAG